MKLSELTSRIPRYMAARRGMKAPLPANMTFSVIDRCNMACRTCGIWKNRDTDEMAVEEYESVVDPLDLYWVTISGGEPFMREDFAELMDVIVNGTEPSYVTIATNGMLHSETREAMEEILQASSDTEFVLNFSVDGPSGTHEYLRRTRDAFEKVRRTIEETRGLDSDRISIGANTVVSKYNEESIPETYRDVQEKLDPDSFIAEVAEQRDKLYNDEMEFAPGDPGEALRFLLETTRREDRRGPPRVVKLMRTAFYTYLLGERKITNYTGFVSAQCNPDGEVWPTSMDSRVMGNLRQNGHDFRALWNSQRADEVRSHIRAENPQDMLANSFYNNMLCQPWELARLLHQARRIETR